MLPASLPICVFFTLYVLAAAGFLIAQIVMIERDVDGLQRGDLMLAGISAVFWPILALWLVVGFVRARL